MQTATKRIVCLAGVALLSACGGGGGSDDQVAQAANNPPIIGAANDLELLGNAQGEITVTVTDDGTAADQLLSLIHI